MMKHPIRRLTTVLGALAITVAAAVAVPATPVAARSTAPEGLEAHPAMQMHHTALQHAAMLNDSLAAPAVAQVLAAIVAVDIVDDAFRPASISVPVGTTVTWTNRGSSAHTVTGAGFDSVKTSPGASYSFTFASAGTFRYVCSFHGGMSGTVVVTAAAATPPPVTTTPPPSTTTPPPTGGTTVDMGDNYFNPRSLTVAAGSTVTWVDRGSNMHTVTTNDALFHSGLLAPGQSFSYRFTTPGTYLYLCAIHPSMTGTITVTGTAATAPPPAPAPGGAIELRDNFFSPPTFTVAAGTPVTWVNRGAVKHTVTSASFDSGLIASGGTFSFTFKTPGTYPYQCDLHTGMTGTVVVTGTAAPGPDPAPIAAPIAAPARAPTAAAPATGGVTTVVIGENNFTPGVTTVAAGTTVVWENHGLVKHTVTSSGPTVFDSGLLSRDGRFSVTFDQPGSFPYICELHPGMNGTIDVVGTTGGAPGAAPGPVSAPALPAAPSPTPATVAALPEDTAHVFIVDNAFDAPKITVVAGTTVTWLNHGQAKHNVIFSNGGPSSELLGSGQAFSRKFDLPGTYGYLCALHPAMAGTVTVTSAPVAVVNSQASAAATTNKAAAADSIWFPMMAGLLLGGLFALTVGGLLGVRLLTRD